MFLLKYFRKKKPINPDFCSIPLISSNLCILAHNSVVLLTLNQTYKNDSSNPQEVHYSFPSLSRATLVSLNIILSDGSVIVAKVNEKESASEQYQDAIASGDTAVMAKQDKVGRLKMMIGNLLPNDIIKVEVKISYPVSCQDYVWNIVVPLDCFTDYKIIKDYSMFFNLQTSRSILKHSCNFSNNLKLSENKLSLIGKITSFKDTDLIITFDTSDSQIPSCIFQRYQNAYYAMISVIPKFEDQISLNDAEGNGEFIFLLDRSGSMRGESIELAKQAAILFIKSLPESSYFNIISFGSNFRSMFQSSRENTTTNVELALNKIKKFDADMGGTNIYKPLRHVFSLPGQFGYSKILFLLTDGQVDKKSRVIKLIKSNNSEFKVNSFGIGYSFDEDLIKRSAEAGNGIPNFVNNIDEIGKKVIFTLSKCLIPTLSNWQLLCDGENHPAKFGTLNYGQRFIIYSKLDEIPMRSISIKVYDNYIKDFKQIELCDFQETSMDIYKLWAHSKIKDLQVVKNKSQEVISLSIESGVPSKLTSLFCQKTNKDSIISEMKIVSISKIIQSDYLLESNSLKKCASQNKSSGLFSFSNPFSMKKSCKQSNLMLANSKCMTRSSGIQSRCQDEDERNSGEMDESNKRHMRVQVEFEKTDESDSIHKNRSAKKHITNKLEFMELISLQTSSGSWNYSDFHDNTKLLEKIPIDFIQCDDQENVLCTLMALAYLNSKYKSKHDEWFLIEKKAIKWLLSKKVNYRELENQLMKFLD